MVLLQKNREEEIVQHVSYCQKLEKMRFCNKVFLQKKEEAVQHGSCCRKLETERFYNMGLVAGIREEKVLSQMFCCGEK